MNFRLANRHTVHRSKADEPSFPTPYRTPAADIMLPSFCQITSLHCTELTDIWCIPCTTSTEFQYCYALGDCGCPHVTAHPFFVLTLHNHTSIESARSEHSNGVWYVFSRAHSVPIEQLTYCSIYYYDSRGINYVGA